MELIYRSIPIIEDSHPSIDKIWRVKDMLICNVSDDGECQIRVPIYLYSYNFEFGIKTKDTSTNKWWPRSKTQTIKIPSFLNENIFDIGDMINFRNSLNCRMSTGKIMEKIGDTQNYKILYQKWDKDKDEHIPTELIIHSSNICRKSNNEMMVEINDDTDMINNLLIQRNDELSINIFDAIKNHYEVLTQSESYEMYGKEHYTKHWENMADFITKSVFDYLFEPQFEYKVACFMDDTYKKNNYLVMNNLRAKDIANDYEMLKKQKNGDERNNNNNENVVDSFDLIEYGCDWCRGLITEWQFVYSCNGENWDNVHDICLFCTNTVIVLNKELHKLLSNILKDNLNRDCISEIVHFTIGKVIYTEFDSTDDDELLQNDLMVLDQNEDGNRNSRKRKLGDIDDIPDAKRRRLN